MCGIIACVGTNPALPTLLEALRRLEYRGYDSAGVAVPTPSGRHTIVRSVARMAGLSEAVVDAVERSPELAKQGSGIGHTRWATHGLVEESNAHPLGDCTGRISIAHNGIIENADELRTELIAAGHAFASSVDSEVVAHLVEDGMRNQASLHTAVDQAVARLRGSWAIVVLDSVRGHVVAAVHRSPLVIARTMGGAVLASDVNAIAAWAPEFRVIEDGDSVEVRHLSDRWRRGGKEIVAPALHAMRWSQDASAQQRIGDSMGVEIGEQPAVAARVLDRFADRIADGRMWAELQLPPFERVVMLGCGTSLNAGRAIASVFTRLGQLPTRSVVASEAASTVIEPRTLVIAISQSGETADILHALDCFGERPQAVLALTNTTHSSLARRADALLDCHAGPEIGVAATKTFTAQVMTGAALALSALAAMRRIEPRTARAVIDELERTPLLLTTAIELASTAVPALALELRDASGYLFLGRGTGLLYAAEGALKLKELSYRWAETYAAGELKHGPLALVDTGTPVFVIESSEPRLAINVAEVAARGGRVLTVGGADSTLPVTRRGLGEGHTDQRSPWGPLPAVVALQLFARSMALELGLDVDKPRNLAKSVTVD
ncbi:glucosamine--fructose-6-phosphate aminotransferase (isomerizing) [Pseudoclavibacter sp. JAI123]|uniref:glutamine--fructose-6-phosphate transaminase (isomerizing) n=1 Tax=Pseudoclavibacter sp. JAI123 TaxID=2723065 RepID=UPI0015CC35C2|nr:glutamine--fructose-6-phosphate transaminase (isomerizing) [Pseudoclavibacter sp. JAI123]NYF12064.1 glucosamine--fructose-6-phosphate aminotransferase (isomerizing) [Pseudoclavibacter sp. JAI123]